MIGKIKNISRNKTTVFALLILLILLVLAGCAKERTLKPADKIEGSLSIDGENIALQYVCARRAEGVRDERDPTIEIILANEKIPDETLAKLFADLVDDYVSDREILKGTSIKAVHLQIDKTQGSKDKTINFRMKLLRPGDVQGLNAVHEFETFDLKKGFIKAKMKNEWQQTSYRGETPREVKCSYTIAFETMLSGANPETGSRDSASRPPEEGIADGMVQTKDAVIALKYAYACKVKMFFDEPEVKMNLLITSDPIPEKYRLEALDSLLGLDNDVTPEGAIRITVGQFGRLEYGYIQTKSENLSTNRFTPNACVVESDKIQGSFRQEKDEDSSVDFSIKDFSVNFNAPLKN